MLMSPLLSSVEQLSMKIFPPVKLRFDWKTTLTADKIKSLSEPKTESFVTIILPVLGQEVALALFVELENVFEKNLRLDSTLIESTVVVLLTITGTSIILSPTKNKIKPIT